MNASNTRNLGLCSKQRTCSILVYLASMLFLSGCTGLQEWVRNGYKVGPNYQKPPAPVADQWIDVQLPDIKTESPDLREWWTVFDDPVLNSLISEATQRNLDVRTAGTRILEARSQRNIAAGNLFPQLQDFVGDYARFGLSGNTANTPAGVNRFFDNWAAGVNLSWELDFWGRFRRAIEAADSELDASVENYDDVLVLLIADVASTYVDIRTFQKRIQFADANIAQQTKIVKDAQTRAKGIKGGPDEIAYNQLRATLKDTQALKEQLELGLRQANNRLCTLLGLPPRDLLPLLGQARIPVTPAAAAVGLPVELLRRRPDVRRAERRVAAQSARIGIATTELYPRISLIGSLGYEADSLSELFTSKSFRGNIGPNMQWSILNYGRLVNGIRVQDARFQTEALNYQNTVLRAGREVEDGLVGFIRFQLQAKHLSEGVKNSTKATNLVTQRLLLKRDADYLNWLFTTVNFQTSQQDRLAVAQGNIALSLIQIYKALGGGWQIRLDRDGCFPATGSIPVQLAPGSPEPLPQPKRMPALGRPRQAGIGQVTEAGFEVSQSSASVYHPAGYSFVGNAQTRSNQKPSP